MDPKPNTQQCPLCKRNCPIEIMQRHHLQTRKVDKQDVEWICRDCHNTIHAFFDNKQIADDLHSIDALLANEDLVRAFKFIGKRPPATRTRTRTSRDRRSRRRR